MPSHGPSPWRSMLVVLGGIGLFLIALMISGGSEAFWQSLGVDPLRPAFADLRNITSALDCVRLGYDPLVEDPCDPWDRPMNYPRVWLLLGELGLGEAATEPLGYGLAALFLLTAALLARALRPREAVVYTALLLSPAVLLGLERGNNDLFVFVLVVCAASALDAPGRRALGGWALLGLGAVLKLYPVFTFATALRERPRRAVAILAGVVLLFGAYLFVTRADVVAIRDAVPNATLSAYGYRVLFQWLAWNGLLSDLLARALAAGTLFVVGTGSLAVGLKSTPLPRPDRAFDLSALLYVGTFALGFNFDYRLVFVLIAVPTLLRWARGDGAARGSARLLLGIYAFIVWSTWFGTHLHPLGDTVFVLEEIAGWVLFGGLLVLLVRSQSSLPEEAPEFPQAARRASIPRSVPPSQSVPLTPTGKGQERG